MGSVRGPKDRLHIPSHRDGCYYQRYFDCCWLCKFRLFAGAMPTPLSSSSTPTDETSDQPLVGDDLAVPVVQPCDELPEIDYAIGTVTDVNTSTNGIPESITVELTGEEEVPIDIPTINTTATD